MPCWRWMGRISQFLPPPRSTRRHTTITRASTPSSSWRWWITSAFSGARGLRVLQQCLAAHAVRQSGDQDSTFLQLQALADAIHRGARFRAAEGGGHASEGRILPSGSRQDLTSPSWGCCVLRIIVALVSHSLPQPAPSDLFRFPNPEVRTQ